jgi:hypothetical protein
MSEIGRALIERARRKAPANLDAYDYLLRALPHVLANTPRETVTIWRATQHSRTRSRIAS